MYKAAICAGTFDKLHNGHKSFLKYACSLAETVYVTITSDAYTAAHKPYVASFADRSAGVLQFLSQEGLTKKIKIVPIDDVYGISLNASLPIDAIIVTEETLKGAQVINERRLALGLAPLLIELAPFENGETGLRISSTQLRTGIVSSSGEVAIKHDFMQATLHLPEKLRERLQKPFGKIIDSAVLTDLSTKRIIAVGDVTTRVLHEKGIHQELSFVDFVIQRQQKENSLRQLGFDGTEVIIHAKNPPGTLTPFVWSAIQEAWEILQTKKEVVVVIDGEEDLVVLPLLLLAPFGWTICYGQPYEGMVMVPVNHETKKEAMHLLTEFTKVTTRGH